MIQDDLKIHISSTLNMYSQDGTHTDTKISFNPPNFQTSPPLSSINKKRIRGEECAANLKSLPTYRESISTARISKE